MRLAYLLLCCLCFTALAQQDALDRPVSVNLRQATYAEAFEAIGIDLGIPFLYSPSHLPADKRISFDAQGLPLREVLRSLLQRTSLGYIYQSGTIVIKKRKDLFGGAEELSMIGFLTDEKTGEAIMGAELFIPSLRISASSNQYGFYTFSLPQGRYELEINAAGYTFKRLSVTLHSSRRLDIKMSEFVINLDTLDIIGKNLVPGTAPLPDISRISVSLANTKQVPTFLGEFDPMKTIALFPGIQPAGEGNTGLFIRGGGADQNLILIDETPIYNASHLLGFFSTFNADAIKEVSVLKGGIPAQHGGRLSSIIDIRTREGNKHKPSLSGGIGNISGRLTFETPFADTLGTFIISGRRTYLDLLLKAVPNSNLSRNKLFFYDVNAKATLQLGKKDHLSVSAYTGGDDISLLNLFGTDWLNQTLTARWSHAFSSKAFSTLTYYMTRFGASSEVNLVSPLYGYRLNYELNDMGLKQHISYSVTARTQLEGGYYFVRHRYLFGEITPASNASLVEPLELAPEFALEGGAYMSANVSIMPRLMGRFGLRWSAFGNIGEASVYIYDTNPVVSPATSLDNVIDTVDYRKGEVYNAYQGFEPRVSLNYQMPSNSALRFAYDRTRQYIHQLTNTNTPSPVDMWTPVNAYIPPQIGDQFTAGYAKSWPRQGISLTLDVYGKLMQHQLDFKPQASLLLNNHLETEILLGRGWAYGLEMLLRKDAGRFKGWISYTLSKSERQINGINQNRVYPTSFDRRHNLSTVLTYRVGDKVLLSANWTYASGIAYTFPVGKYEIDGVVLPYYTSRNGFRLEPVHRLDLSLTVFREMNEDRKNESSFVFSLYNAYAKKNTYAYVFRPSNRNPSGTETVKIYLFSIVPSFTYNFHF